MEIIKLISKFLLRYFEFELIVLMIKVLYKESSTKLQDVKSYL